MPGTVKRTNLPDLPKGGPYSQAVVHGNTVYLSGIVGVSKGEDKSFGEQWNTIAERASKILSSVGSDFSGRSLKLTVYLSDAIYFKDLNDAFRFAFGENAPARTTIVCGFTIPEVKVEVDIIASTD